MMIIYILSVRKLEDKISKNNEIFSIEKNYFNLSNENCQKLILNKSIRIYQTN